MADSRDPSDSVGQRQQAPRFLIVDDDAMVLRQRRRTLRSRCPHWQVFTAESAKAALEQMAIRDYDVVCSDLSMPDMDGIELLSVVRREHPKVVRMLCSGLATGIDEGGPVGGLLHAVLDKTASTEQLIAALERALSYIDVADGDEF
jgi:CheY-like chemotaxis protein